MKHLAALSLVLGLVSTSAYAAPPRLTIAFVSCAGNDGALSVEWVNHPAPLTYLWNTGATTDSIGGLVPGAYSVTVTDGEGQVGTVSHELTPFDANALLQLQAWGFYDSWFEPCVGECNGGVVAELPNFAEDYVFTIDPPQPFQIVGNSLHVSTESTVLRDFCDGATIQVTASNSCMTFGPTTMLIEHQPPAELEVFTVASSCGEMEDGYVTGELTIPQGTDAMFNLWVLDEDTLNWSELMEPFLPGTYPFLFDSLTVGNWRLLLEQVTYNSCLVEIPIRILDRSPNCSTLEGTLHFETDEDCAQDGLEIGIPNQLMRVMPGAYYGLTGPDGSYRVAVPNGDFAVDQVNPDVVQICPPTGAVPFTVGFNGSATVDFADSVLTPFDQRIHLWYDISRVGFPFTYSMTLANDNGYVGENVVVELAYDPIFSFVSATAGVTANDPGFIQWSFPNLAPFEQRVIEVTVQVPPDPGLFGNYYSATTTLSSTTAEVDLSDNSASITHEIVGSYDPNDKQAFTSSRTSEEMYLKDLDSYVDYQIRFQNTGNDTAFTVVVQDTISPLLDMASLMILGASHPFTPSIEAGNVLQFQFNDILLPDSNVNEVESHGFVAFRMKPVDNGLLGTRIDNAADIYFDFNEPVRTNTASLQVSLSTSLAEGIPSTIRLSPVPTTDQLTLHYEGVTTSISIQSLDGRTVLELPGTRTIDVAQLSAGVYLLQARTEGGEVLQARFVKW